MSGLEGLADIQIVQALFESARSGQPVKLAPFHKSVRPSEAQEMEKSAVKPEKDLVHPQSASAQ